MQIFSTAFQQLGSVPIQYTCEALNISPPLRFQEVPLQAKSLVLIVEDPDAPDPTAPLMVWDHWILYNIPVTITELAENVSQEKLDALGILCGLNSWNQTDYGGPCPPIGTHRYYFKLYALDRILPDLGKPNKVQLMKQLDGAILEQVELIGMYKKEHK